MVAADSASPPQRRFTFHGPIRIWDLAERRLSLGGRELWLAPEVQTGDLELGTEIVAKGYEGQQDGRWIVDVVTVTGVVEPWRRRPTRRGAQPPR
jgi:hypothetical protein